jgi:hypothetical protein
MRKKRWNEVQEISGLLDAELFVNVEFNGYDDPGQAGAPVEDSYPPESEDERLVRDGRIVFYSAGGKACISVNLTSGQMGEIRTAVEKEVEKMGLPEVNDLNEEPGD